MDPQKEVILFQSSKSDQRFSTSVETVQSYYLYVRLYPVAKKNVNLQVAVQQSLPVLRNRHIKQLP